MSILDISWLIKIYTFLQLDECVFAHQSPWVYITDMVNIPLLKPDNYVTIMAADVLALCIATTSTAKLLAMKERRKEKFQLLIIWHDNGWFHVNCPDAGKVNLEDVSEYVKWMV